MSKRQTIRVPGYTPVNPIPVAARKGPLVVTGGIEGIDPKTEQYPPGAVEQVSLTFSNVERILAAAGCGWPDVVKLEFFIRTPELRKLINDEWLRIFPNDNDRPARQVRPSDSLPAGALLQCVAMAWAGD